MEIKSLLTSSMRHRRSFITRRSSLIKRCNHLVSQRRHQFNFSGLKRLIICLWPQRQQSDQVTVVDNRGINIHLKAVEISLLSLGHARKILVIPDIVLQERPCAVYQPPKIGRE